MSTGTPGVNISLRFRVSIKVSVMLRVSLGLRLGSLVLIDCWDTVALSYD